MIHFGPFQIDPRTWTLTREGLPVDLSPAGWIIPVDPMLEAVRALPGQAGLLAKLAARAS